MKTWICRILTLVFFVNCLPAQTFAARARSSKKKQTLETKIAEKVLKTPYEEWQEEIEELNKVLQSDDLTPDERKFAELEKEMAILRIELVDTLAKSNNVTGTNNRYHARMAVVSVQEKDLEEKMRIRNFYQMAQSDKMIAAAVYAMHQHATDSQVRYQQAKLNSARFNEVKLPEIHVEHVEVPESRILDMWAHNTISVEELVEYADPLSDANASTADIADAALLLFYVYYGYNQPTSNLDPDSLANVVWLAKRLQQRTKHQLYVLEQQAQQANSLNYVQARGNLMLLNTQVRNFLKEHQTQTDQEALFALDKQLADYAAIKDKLAGFTPNLWAYSPVVQAITQEIKQAIQTHPSKDSYASQVLVQNLSYVTNYLIATGYVGNVAEILALLNKDRENFHGNNEQYVNAVFGSIFDTMISYPLSTKTQQAVRQLIRCSAAPVCTYIDAKKTNAVNVRVQALAVGSMLRQVAKTNKIPMENPFDKPEEVSTSLSKELFEDQAFRTEMAAYTMDIYGPAQPWNVSKIKRYGLSLDELQKFSNYLARVFESYLPVPHPKTTYIALKGGVYKNCTIREIDTNHLVPLKSLESTRGAVRASQSEDGYNCSDLSDAKRYGGLDHEIVNNSAGYLVGITRFNPFNRQQALTDLTNKLLEEVASWYLFGAALKGIGYLWKGVRAASLATRAATKASSGFKMARFNSKFSQVMKFSTDGWKTEMGLVNVTELRETNTILLEMHRPGFQGIRMELSEAVLKGNSLTTLKGRILLRRALQSNIYASVGKSAQAMHIKAATKNANLLGTVTNDLADELARPLSKLEQRVVQNEHSLVYATERELAEGNIISQTYTVKGMPLTIYRPVKIPTPHIDLSTGLPEGFALNPLNGNITGKVSGNYLGTLSIPYVENIPSYNIAAGLTHAPSSKFLGNVFADRYPIIPQIKGLTKYVAGMTAVDIPVNLLFVKPYMESFAKRQDKDLAQATGADLGQIKAQEKSPVTLLSALQGLQSKDQNIAGSLILGLFLGINLGLNKVLPDPIQTFRRSLFKTTTKIASAIDDPIANALGNHNSNILPLPGQMLSFPMMLLGDPTPQYSDAAKAHFSLVAKNQQADHSRLQHNLVSFQDQMDNDAAAFEKGLPLFLEQNNLYLSALPKADKEMKRAYKTYIQAVKSARKKANTNLEQANNDVNAASTKFVNTQADIMQRAVKAYIAQQKNRIPADLSEYKKHYQFLFTEQVEQEYTQLLENFYTQHEKDLISIFTAVQRALESHRSIKAMKEEASNTCQQHELNFITKHRQMDQELNKRVGIINAISEQWETDYPKMYPAPSSMLLLPQEAQLQIQQVFTDFLEGIESAKENITSSAALQETYDSLLQVRNHQFEVIKTYWINVNPLYKHVFENTISVMQEAAKAKAQAEAQQSTEEPTVQ